MHTDYFKQYSASLNKDMECKIYGHSGRPVLFIPCQDGRFYDFENFHMTDVWAPWINSGEVMVFSIDTIDEQSSDLTAIWTIWYMIIHRFITFQIFHMIIITLICIINRNL